MKNYCRVMLGRKSIHADECFAGGFIGADFGIAEDLTGKLPDNWRAFNAAYIPVYLAANPGKSKVVAGLACGAIWTITKGLQQGDIVLSPDGAGTYRIGQISGGYSYVPDGILPHRRAVTWLPQTISRAEMSEALQNSTGSIGTVCSVNGYAVEIESFLKGHAPSVIVSTDETIEDAMSFVMEKHLEEFLIGNWTSTDLGQSHDLLRDEGELVGQQYATDTGAIDILAISKDKKELLVIELKKGRASDAVVGQILRYMGYVKDVLAEEEQTVSGAIIALEDDQRIRRALSIVPSIAFYRYKIEFTLLKGVP